MKFSTCLPSILALMFTFAASDLYADGRVKRHKDSYSGPARSEGAREAATTDGRARRPVYSSQCGTMNRQACKAFHEVNNLRIRQGLQPLDGLSRCTTAAQAHAENMARNNFFSHDAPDESWKERMDRFQLTKAAVAENIAQTPSGPTQAVNLWINSPGHFRNMVNQNFESAGMGHSQGYYVHCFSGKPGYELQ